MEPGMDQGVCSGMPPERSADQDNARNAFEKREPPYLFFSYLEQGSASFLFFISVKELHPGSGSKKME